MITDEMTELLIKDAAKARERSYCLYSEFAVGAALLCGGGRIIEGCNVENNSLGATICAERAAFARAIAEGEKNFCAIAVVGGPKRGPCADICVPCGVCLQVMAEFCDSGSFEIICADTAGNYKKGILKEFLPFVFNTCKTRRKT